MNYKTFAISGIVKKSLLQRLIMDKDERKKWINIPDQFDKINAQEY